MAVGWNSQLSAVRGGGRWRIWLNGNDWISRKRLLCFDYIFHFTLLLCFLFALLLFSEEQRIWVRCLLDWGMWVGGWHFISLIDFSFFFLFAVRSVFETIFFCIGLKCNWNVEVCLHSTLQNFSALSYYLLSYLHQPIIQTSKISKPQSPFKVFQFEHIFSSNILNGGKNFQQRSALRGSAK